MKQKRKSNERSDRREQDYRRRRISKDNKRGASRSKSRSRSRERRKEHTRSQRTSLPSRDKVEPRSKDKSRRRTRSRSRDRKKNESSKSTGKVSNVHVSSSRDTNRSQERKREDVTQRNLEEAKCAEVNKKDLPSSFFTSQVKKEPSDCAADSQIRTAENQKQIKNEKEIIEEKTQSVDMFEDPLIAKPVEMEENDSASPTVSKSIDEAPEHPLKTESCLITNITSESSPSVFPSSTLASHDAEDVLEDSASQSEPIAVDSDKELNTATLTATVKQETSDSEDEFNVDVMLDRLDFMKSEQSECSGVAANKEIEVVEEKEEEEQSSVVGSKSKSQVKRVTWNIQEPEGPQPEKSPSSEFFHSHYPSLHM